MAFKILLVALMFLTVFFILRLLTLILSYIVQKWSRFKDVLKARPVAEFIVWLLTFFFAINFLFRDRFYYVYFVVLFLVITILFFSWFWAKDWVAGVIFRTLHNFQKGDYVQLAKNEGHVQYMGTTHIVIDTPAGKTLKIPYSQLMNKPVSEHFEVAGTGNASFLLEVSEVRNEQELLEHIQEVTQLSPWHVQSKIPIVRIVDRPGRNLKIEVVVHTRNKEHAIRLEKAIKEEFTA